MLRPFSKWPVLLGAAMCIAIGAVLIRDVPNGNIVTGLVLVAIGCLLLGVFIVLEVQDRDESGVRTDVGDRHPQDDHATDDDQRDRGRR